MPRRKRNSGRNQVVDSDDDDMEETPVSQPQQATSRGGFDHLVGRVVRYMLSAHQKPGISAARIKKIFLANSTNDFRTVIAAVKQHLENTFGLKVLELKGSKYLLVNKYYNRHLLPSAPEDRAKRVLLFLILTFIFMHSDNAGQAIVTEESLWKYLSDLSIIDGNSEHPYFGNVKSIISNKFVEQMYLTRSKSAESESIFYQWGPRALHEMDYRTILEFVSKTYDNRSIKTWPIQYSVMQRFDLHGVVDDDDDDDEDA